MPNRVTLAGGESNGEDLCLENLLPEIRVAIKTDLIPIAELRPPKSISMKLQVYKFVGGCINKGGVWRVVYEYEKDDYETQTQTQK